MRSNIIRIRVRVLDGITMQICIVFVKIMETCLRREKVKAFIFEGKTSVILKKINIYLSRKKMSDLLKIVLNNTTEFNLKDNLIKWNLQLDNNSSKEIYLTLKLPYKSIEPVLDIVDRYTTGIDISSRLKEWLNTDRYLFNNFIINYPNGHFNNNWMPKVFNGLSKISNSDTSSFTDKCNLAYGHLDYNAILPLVNSIHSLLHNSPQFLAGPVLLVIVSLLNNVDSLDILKSRLGRLSLYYWDLILVRLENILSAVSLYNLIKAIVTWLLAITRRRLNYLYALNSNMFNARFVRAWPGVPRTVHTNGRSLFANPIISHRQSVVVPARLINRLTHIWIEYHLYITMASLLILCIIRPLESYITSNTTSGVIQYAYDRLRAEETLILQAYNNLMTNNSNQVILGDGVLTSTTDDHLYGFNWYTFRIISNSTVPFYSYNHYGDDRYILNSIYDHVTPDDWESYNHYWNINRNAPLPHHMSGFEFTFLSGLLDWLQRFFR